MAEQPAKKGEAKEAAPAAAPAGKSEKKEAKGGAMKSMPVMLGVVMVLEAVVLFAGFKFIGGGGPKAASGAELTDGHGGGGEAGGHGGPAGEKGPEDKKKIVAVELPKCRAVNAQSGRKVMYEVQIFVRTRNEHLEKVQTAVKDNDAVIRDRIRNIIASIDPDKLGGGTEPRLETLRRQIKHQLELDEIIPEGMIEEVLVTGCTPFPAGS